MGTGYATYVSVFQAAGTYAFRTMYMGLLGQRMNNSPVVRLLKRYFARSDAGSSSGGGGSGTSQSSPYLVRHGKDLATLISAVLVTNMQLALRCGDTFDASGGAFNITLTGVDGWTLGQYGDGPDPVVSGFFTDDGMDWTSIGSGAWSKPFAKKAISWVRQDVAPSKSLTLCLENVFTKCQTQGQVQAIASGYGFQSDIFTTPGSSTVTVKNNGADPSKSRLQMCIGTGIGISISSADLWRVDGITIIGFGCDDANSLNGPIVADLVSTREGVISRVKAYYSGKHTITQVNSGAGYGICTIVDCFTGLMRNPTSAGTITGYTAANPTVCTSAGHLLSTGDYTDIQNSNGTVKIDGHRQVTVLDANTFTVAVDCTAGGGTSATWQAENKAGESALVACYNAIGNHEVIIHNLDSQYGTLPNYVGTTLQAAKRGSDFLAHTGGGGNTTGLAFAWGCKVRKHTYGCKSNGWFNNSKPYSTYRGSATEYRAFIVDQLHEGGDETEGVADVDYYIRLNNRIYAKRPAATPVALGVFSLTTMHGIRINCFFEWDWTAIVASGLFRCHGSLSANHAIDNIRTHFRHKRKSGEYYCIEAVGANVSNLNFERNYDCIFDCEQGQTPGEQTVVLNQAPGTTTVDTVAGGARNCVFRNTPPLTKLNNGSPPTTGYWGYGSTPGYLDNATTPAVGAITPLLVPLATDAIYGRGSATVGASGLPITVEHDIDWQPCPAAPSIGPVQPRTWTDRKSVV